MDNKRIKLVMITGEKPLLTGVKSDFLQHKKHEQKKKTVVNCLYKKIQKAN